MSNNYRCPGCTERLKQVGLSTSQKYHCDPQNQSYLVRKLSESEQLGVHFQATYSEAKLKCPSCSENLNKIIRPGEVDNLYDCRYCKSTFHIEKIDTPHGLRARDEILQEILNTGQDKNKSEN